MSKLQSRLKKRLEKKRNPAVEEAKKPLKSPATDKSALLAELQGRIKTIETGRAPSIDNEHKAGGEQNIETNPAADNGADAAPERVVTSDHSLPGTAVSTPLGDVWVNKERYDSYDHGSEPVEGYLKTGSGLAALAKDKKLQEVLPPGALFVDTETTGLSGGTGTIPFLIGIGYFEHSSFFVEHLFCREPDEEPAQLFLLAQKMKEATHLVSFNGKSFDIPLINTRFIVNRVANPGYNLPHLDLLHVARRIFKRRLENRSLQSLEKEILGFHRYGDIPGAEIPEVYRNWLNGTDLETVVKVLEHNSYDILALAALGSVLDRMYTNPSMVSHPADHIGYAQAAYVSGAQSHGDTHLSRADTYAETDDKLVALHMGAREQLRRKNHKEAREIWLKILDDFPDDSLAHLRLAKHYEHKEKKFDKALHHAESATELEGEQESKKRCDRILRKQSKRTGRRR